MDGTNDHKVRIQGIFDADRFLAYLDTLIRIKTCVDQNQPEFVAARAWIEASFDPAVTAVDSFTFGDFTWLIIRSRDSSCPSMLGNGHIEVVPGRPGFFLLRQKWALLYNRGVAHMKTQCHATSDLRFTEREPPEKIAATLESIGRAHEATFAYREIGVAAYYPCKRALARRYIELLQWVSGKEPPKLHSNGASNSRFYVMQKPNIQILMSNPRVIGAHADNECLDARSLPSYYQLVRHTIRLI